ncbi:class I SAM-dependent methyltransferase [Marinivivus vitaminiproducens]|uniref:class I SAM-dependent methyltransferase n=1 Tax=Marinivivus vitaminiproducens TaxID=3035935 RepID=UPI0027A012D1|nr:class I SAM-dependent methyltransferase [Geminicoccaceae bacterium SCSIO 64248]
MSTTYGTWYKETGRDAQMADGHRPYWRHFIETVPESDLSRRTVLDFGCNRGGFLDLLHALKPYRRAVGVDIATESVEAARRTCPHLPAVFEVAHDLARWPEAFDVAFSYEVIYLLPDLAFHARQIAQALRPGGVYYAVTGCHTASPLWPRWRELIAATSNAPVQDHAPDDFIQAFAGAGLEVSFRQFGYKGFVPAVRHREYYPDPIDAIRYADQDKLLFRLVKPDA